MPIRSYLLLLLLLGAGAARAGGSPAGIDAWFDAAFLHQAPAAEQPGLNVRRQDYLTLRLRQSVMKTPLQIGQRHFAHGLGTHVVSEIAVTLPAPAAQFTAQVGVDNNYDTQGKRGSVIFAVELGGKELFRSGICRGGEAPVAVQCDLHGATRFTLRVLDAGDGPGWGQSDWAEAAVKLENGTTMFLDELPLAGGDAGLSTGLPFSFVYDGKSSADLLPGWKREVTAAPAKDGQEPHTITYTDPATGLQLCCTVVRYTDTPAAEWVLTFTNTGAADTPILEHVLPLDLRLTVPEGAVTLHRLHGSECSKNDFLPIDEPLGTSSHIDVAPNGGRSSNGQFPFFNLAWRGGGLVGAIGWSGQWAFHAQRNDTQCRLQAGQQTTHLLLHPGESIRTPRILLVSWEGSDRFLGNNRLRRLLLAHYVPRHNGEVIPAPITANTWFVYHEGNNTTEANQKAVMPHMVEAGVEGYWLDAGWFEGGWPNGAGSWVPKKDAFPNGLKPIGNEAHRLGMQFVLWFEPERVTAISRVAKEHPEWVMHHPGDGDWGRLYDLGNPAARAWLTDYLSRCIGDWGIDIYRNDFNIDPLPFWQAADTPDRQGMAEIRYVEGLYAMWDALLARHPGLWIDNCAGGGCRIDIETLRRSIPLWQSDTQCCGHDEPVGNQVQNAGISQYVPLHAAGVWAFDKYNFRGIATTGYSICANLSQDPAVPKQARAMAEETKALRPYYLGDYYPLLPINQDEQSWCGWQYHRADLDAGFLMLFRRGQSPFAAVDVALHGLDAHARYVVTNMDTGDRQTLTGAALAQKLTVAIPEMPGSALIRYGREQ